MRYKLLGRSGLRVSELCLGTMTFGEDWGWGAGKDESRRMVDAFFDAGGNFIDTANLYTNGTSETFLGEFLEKRRDQAVLATKYTNAAPGKDPNAGGNQRKNMFQAVEASLKRLRTDYIDLYWMHIWDQITPVEEVMRSFDDLVRQGKVLYCGISDAPAWWIARANTMAELRNWSPFVALQIEWSLIERTVERELVPMARALGLAITPWSPLASGSLTGKHTNPDGSPKQAAEPSRLKTEMADAFGPITPQKHQIAATVLQIAKDTGHSPAQVALNWLRRQSAAHSPVIPIIGARKLTQFTDNLECLEWNLEDDHVRKLDEVSAIEQGFPTTFFNNPMVRNFAYAGTRDLIDA